MSKNTLNQSIFIHLVIILFLLAIIKLEKSKFIETFEFTLIEAEEVIQVRKKPKIVINATAAGPKEKSSKRPIREVFGLKRKSLTNKEGTIIVKKGNTLTKKEDDKVLNEDDVDSLPSPAEEFLITSMPRAIVEFRPEYPKWAKEEGITGSVIFDILIDEKGKVRQVKLIKSLHPKLDILAEKAMRKIEFRPAYIEKDPVSVRIKYAIRYVLEN